MRDLSVFGRGESGLCATIPWFAVSKLLPLVFGLIVSLNSGENVVTLTPDLGVDDPTGWLPKIEEEKFDGTGVSHLYMLIADDK